jgi:high-affinity iron transporter
MADVAPVDVFRRITIGVPGTAMPEFEADLPIDDRWAVTAYVLTMSGRSGAVQAAAADVFATVRRQLDSAVAHRSERLAFNAYLTFEQVETDVRAKESRLASELEDGFGTLRGRIATAPPEELAALERRLLADLERAERVVADRGSGANLFAQSFILMVREGFEAILIIGALMAFLTRAGASARRREVARGAWGAVAASVVTWALVQFLFRITPAQREAIEGFTMLLAMVVLFYVSYWLLSKIEVARWNAFVTGKMEAALSTGSGVALAAVAFLAVYREGFETILFYEALLSSSGSSGIGPVLSGLGAGAIALIGVYVAVFRFGLRLPMKPFFAVTSAVLYYMAFVFAGKGIAELQTAGLLPLTPVSWGPRVPLLGVYPTVESLVIQGALLVLAIGALVWVRMSVGGEPTGTGRQPSEAT